MNYQDVLDFWFKESTPKQWFTKDEAFDEQVRSRFGDVYEQAARGKTAEWRSTPEGRVAEVIVLDQFPRNMFRNSPKQYATDELALTLAEEAVAEGADKELSENMRHFLYMPHMHSESKEVHERAVELFKAVGGKALEYEYKHKEIIDRFGRYPHRNEVLGRESTPEEVEFLKTHKGF